MALNPELIIKISGNSEKFQSELRKLERQAQVANGNISKDAMQRQDITEKALIGSYKRIAAGVAAVSVGFAVSLKVFADYETALVAVQRTTNLAGAELEDFKKRIDTLADKLNTPANDLLKIAETAGQLGVTGAADLAKFTEAMAKFNIASSSLKGEEAAAAFARIISISGGKISDIDRYASAVALLGDNFNATEADIAAVAVEVVKVGGVFKLSTINAIALSTGFSEIGVEAEIARSTLLVFGQKTDEVLRKGGDELKLFMALTGMTKDELKKNLQDAPEKIFIAFSKGLKESGQDASRVLETLGLNSRQITPALLTAAGSVETFEKALKQSNDEFVRNEKLNDETQKSLDTTAASWKGVTVAATALAKTIGEEISPVSRTFFGWLEFTLNDINRLLGIMGGLFHQAGQNAKENIEKIRDFIGFSGSKYDLDVNEDDIKYKMDRMKRQAEEERKLLADHIAKKNKINAGATPSGNLSPNSPKATTDDGVGALRESLAQKSALLDNAGKEEVIRQAAFQALLDRMNQDRIEKDAAAEEEKKQKKDEDLEERINNLATIDTLETEARENLIKNMDGFLDHSKGVQKALVAGEKNRVDAQKGFNKAIIDSSLDTLSVIFKDNKAASVALLLVKKAMAVADILVNSQVAASLAIATLPPPFGEAVAAQRIAQGSLQAGIVAATAIPEVAASFAAAQGGRVPGGFGGGDKVPMLLEPGESIVPKNLTPNFEQFIREERGIGGGRQTVEVKIGLDANASRVLTVKQREDKKLGIQK